MKISNYLKSLEASRKNIGNNNFTVAGKIRENFAAKWLKMLLNFYIKKCEKQVKRKEKRREENEIKEMINEGHSMVKIAGKNLDFISLAGKFDRCKIQWRSNNNDQ